MSYSRYPDYDRATPSWQPGTQRNGSGIGGGAVMDPTADSARSTSLATDPLPPGDLGQNNSRYALNAHIGQCPDGAGRPIDAGSGGAGRQARPRAPLVYTTLSSIRSLGSPQIRSETGLTEGNTTIGPPTASWSGHVSHLSAERRTAGSQLRDAESGGSVSLLLWSAR